MQSKMKIQNYVKIFLEKPNFVDLTFWKSVIFRNSMLIFQINSSKNNILDNYVEVLITPNHNYLCYEFILFRFLHEMSSIIRYSLLYYAFKVKKCNHLNTNIKFHNKILNKFQF